MHCDFIGRERYGHTQGQTPCDNPGRDESAIEPKPRKAKDCNTPSGASMRKGRILRLQVSEETWLNFRLLVSTMMRQPIFVALSYLFMDTLLQQP